MSSDWKTKVMKGVVAHKGGKFWGVQYEDGKSTTYGWGPIDNAMISDPRFCRTPTDMTYAGSGHIEELNSAELLPVMYTETWEVSHEE